MNKVNFALAQVVPNEWAVLYRPRVIWWLKCEEEDGPILLNTNQLLAYFKVKRAPRMGSCFYLCIWKILGTVIEGISSVKKKEREMVLRF